MAKKRLAFDVEEDLHTALKQGAAEKGVTLGALCSAILEGGPGAGQPPVPVELDPEMYASLPLDRLRAEAESLGTRKPKGWETLVRRINAEIVKRYVIR